MKRLTPEDEAEILERTYGVICKQDVVELLEEIKKLREEIAALKLEIDMYESTYETESIP